MKPLLAAAMILVTAVRVAGAQGVHVALTPAQQTVAPGAQFDVVIDVTQAGSAFNGFDAVVAYDPQALTFLPTSPTSLQQGCLMTGGCSAACGNTFHVFSAASDSLSASDVLLCNQTSLTGPGALYVLRFQASNTPQVTQLVIRGARFYNAGLFVTPVVAAGAHVTIGTIVGVEAAPAAGLRLRAEPNPAFGSVRLDIRDDRPGVLDVRVIDALGRTVRRLASAWAPGEVRLEWDGRGDAGARMPAGVYWVRVQSGDRVRQTRVTLLR